MSDPTLEVKDVKVSYPVRTVLKPRAILGVAAVSFDVRSGEAFVLVGESGSGKTTLAQAVNGLQSFAGDEVRFEGQRIDTLGYAAMKPIRRRMSMMFQNPVGSLRTRMPSRASPSVQRPRPRAHKPGVMRKYPLGSRLPTFPIAAPPFWLMRRSSRRLMTSLTHCWTR